MFSRQTVMLKNQAQQCSKNALTQMTSIGCYVSNMEDKLVTPTGVYTTADEYHSKKFRAVRVSGLKNGGFYCRRNDCMFFSGHYTTDACQTLAGQAFHAQPETGERAASGVAGKWKATEERRERTGD